MAAYLAVLEPGDTILGMELCARRPPHARLAGELLRQVLPASCATACGATTQRIDYDEVRALAREHRPKMIVAGASAYPRTIDFEAFGAIAREVGAVLLADIAHIAGLVAAGVHPSPVATRGRRHDHHAQDAARPARRHDPVQREQHAEAIDKAVFPGLAGRAARAHHRRQGGRARGGAAARLQATTPRRSCATRRRSPRRCSRAASRWCPAAPTTTSSDRPDASARSTGQEGPGGARPRRHHRPEEHVPGEKRSPCHQRPAHRHARGHHARHARAGDARRSAAGSPTCSTSPDDEARHRAHPRAGARAGARFPLPYKPPA